MRTTWWWTLAVLTACGTDSSVSYVALDPCQPIGLTASSATPVESEGIADAVALWQSHGVTAFIPSATDHALPVIDVQFADAAAAYHGEYDPAHDRVLVNRAVTDRKQLSIVIAHELGHAFGLVHVPGTVRISVMNPDNLNTPPTDVDQLDLEARWGACPAPLAPPR